MRNAPHIAERFHSEGFVVVKQFFAPNELAEMERELQRYVREVVPALGKGEVFYESGSTTAIKSLFHLHRHSPQFARLPEHPRLRELMAVIFPGEEIVCEDVGLFGKPARDGSVTPAHQDNGFSYFEPPHYLKVSIALDASTDENGVLICQRGSHRIGVLPHKPSGVEGFSQMLAEPLDPVAYPEVACRMQPGDITLHHANTVHRSDGNRSARSRRMLSVTFRSARAARNPEKYAGVERARQQLYAETQR